MIVMKLGGTSVGSPEAMKQVAKIIFAVRDKSPIVVTSAMSGITDELLSIARGVASSSREEWLPRLMALRKKHDDVLLSSGNTD